MWKQINSTIPITKISLVEPEINATCIIFCSERAVEPRKNDIPEEAITAIARPINNQSLAAVSKIYFKIAFIFYIYIRS